MTDKSKIRSFHFFTAAIVAFGLSRSLAGECSKAMSDNSNSEFSEKLPTPVYVRDLFSELNNQPGTKIFLPRNQDGEVDFTRGTPLLRLSPTRLNALPAGTLVWSDVKPGAKVKKVGFDNIDIETRGGVTIWGLKPLNPDLYKEEFLERMKPRIKAQNTLIEMIRELEVLMFSSKAELNYQLFTDLSQLKAEETRPGENLNLHELFLRGDFGTPESFWNRFSLGQAYRQRFGADEDFYNAEQSLVDIYVELEILARPN